MAEAGMKQRRGPAALAMLALVFVLGACSLPSVVTRATPTGTATGPVTSGRFTHASCPFSTGAGYFVEGQTLQCGHLAVPEDRSNPASHTIQLAVAIFKTPSHTPAPDPVIFLQGGPGGRIIQDLAQVIVGGQLDLRTQFGNHDLILVDQRGTGYSTPSLQCPEVLKLQYMTDVNVTAQQAADEQNQALAACHTRLVNQGINLSAYTTASDAADIHDLIDALGYPQVDLYGVSYGTRLALEVMRAFPQHIRSVILDSTVPPQRHLLTAVPGAMTRVFNTLFAGCAADPVCSTNYPHLDTVFYGLVAQLNAHPVTFQTTDQSGDAHSGSRFTVLFHGDDLVNIAFTSFYVTQAIGVVPQMIFQVRDGNYQRASQLYGLLIFDDSVAWGMYYSVECAEDVNTLTTSAIAAAGQTYAPALRQDQVIGLESEVPGCQAWNVATAPASEAAPVTSGIPTLVMESEYDPITPPANGDLAAQTLSNSYVFRFPGVGHGAMLFNDCPTSVAIAFWTTPTQKPDGSCVGSMGEPQFV